MPLKLKTALRLGVVGMLGLVALGFLFLCEERIRGKILFARYKHELAGKGESLDPAQFRIGDAAENAAKQIEVLATNLVAGKTIPNSYPRRMVFTQSGRAIAGAQEDSWVDDRVTNGWSGAAIDLRTNRDLLAKIREELKHAPFDNHLTYESGANMRISHLMRAKELALWFGPDAALALHERRLEDATKSLVAEISLMRLLENDRVLISELIRAAIQNLARADTWEALQVDGWSDGQLERIQDAWAAIGFSSNLVQAIKGERVFTFRTLEMCRKSNQETFGLLFPFGKGADEDMGDAPGLNSLPEFVKEQVYCRVWRFAWCDQAEWHYLKGLDEMLAAAGRADHEHSFEVASRELDDLLSRTNALGLFEQVRFPTERSSLQILARSFRRMFVSETDRSLTLAAIALKRYQNTAGQTPEKLGQLVPDFLSSVPWDYMDGKQIKYRRSSKDSFVLYSSGTNFKDEGGDSTILNESSRKRDLWARKDAVWPLRASDQELHEYRAGKYDH